MVPSSAHELHGPAQADAQQTFCAQKPLAHSLLLTQVAIGDVRHTPFMQMPDVQSGSAVHIVAQRVPLASHLYGAHENMAGETHVPAPLHTAAEEYRSPLHVGAMQTVPAT